MSDIENFELRWRDDVVERLREAMEDFEPQRGWVGVPEARVALSLKLGLTPDSAALEVADLAHWERATETRVRVLLQQGQFDAALKVLHERDMRVAASPLFRQEAEALMGLSAFPEALAVAEKGVNSARDVEDTETVFENAHLAARACEATGNKEGAQKWLNQATEAAIRLGQAEKLLRAALLRSRLENWVTTAVEQVLPSLLPAAQNLLKWSTDAPTLRALAAAAGGEDTIRRSVLRRLGIERLSPALSDELAALIAKITGGDGISAQSVRAILASANESIPEPNAAPAAWSQWLAHTSGRSLGNALAELSKEDNEYGVTAEVMAWTSATSKRSPPRPSRRRPLPHEVNPLSHRRSGWRCSNPFGRVDDQWRRRAEQGADSTGARQLEERNFASGVTRRRGAPDVRSGRLEQIRIPPMLTSGGFGNASCPERPGRYSRAPSANKPDLLQSL